VQSCCGELSAGYDELRGLLQQSMSEAAGLGQMVTALQQQLADQQVRLCAVCAGRPAGEAVCCVCWQTSR
jgi:hypothetical protein